MRPLSNVSRADTRRRTGGRWRRWALLTVLVPAVAVAQPPAPSEFPVLRQTADQLLKTGHSRESAELFSRLAHADSSNGSYWLGLADASRALGRPDAAVDALRRAIAVGFGRRSTREYQVAQLYAQTGARDSALVWLDRALRDRYAPRSSIGDDSAFVALFGDSTFLRLAQRAALPMSDTAGWDYDLGILQAEAHRLTPVEAAGQLPSFDSAAAALSPRLAGLTPEQRYAAMQRLVTLLGSGHGVLFPLSTPRLTLRMLPVDLYAFSDGIFVVDGVGAGAALVGSRVDSISGVSASEALRLAAPYIDRDNPMGLNWNGPYFLTYPVLLAAAGIGHGADSVLLSIRDANGRELRTTLVAGEFRPPAKLHAPSIAAIPTPLWLRHPERNYWLETSVASRTIYLQFNQVLDDSTGSIAQLADSLLTTARRLGSRSLFIDVRRNNGGSGALLRPLVRALVQFEGLGPDRRLYVLEGRNTFSAAQNFINMVERWTNALFVGEASSSRPNFVGEDTEILLPYSGIVGSVGSRFFQDSDPLDDRMWISPDIPVRLSSRDYFLGRDPVLEAAMSYAHRLQNPSLRKSP